MATPLSSATPVLTSVSRLVGGVVMGSIDVDRRSRTDDAHLPWDTEGAYGGICGTYYFQDIPHRENTPVVFVHGNTADATIWLPMMESFLERGDTGEDVWAITFRRPSPTHDTMAAQLDDFVGRVRDYTGHDAVNLVSHSLGVTGVRYWLDRYDRYEWVDSFVGLAGANHGSSRVRKLGLHRFPFGPARSSWFLDPDRLGDADHPLARLNEDETPGDVDYYTLRATRDRFFRDNPESPTLHGAVNEQVETNHRGLLRTPEACERVYEWLRSDAGERG
jgi:pimeloyl-ACP methyl ester carboxylesterase